MYDFPYDVLLNIGVLTGIAAAFVLVRTASRWAAKTGAREIRKDADSKD